jgi:hypothetical protein
MFLKEIDPSKPIVFIHIPRTAGTSFRWAAAAQYGNEQVCLVHPGYYTEEHALLKQLEFKFITGHFTMDNSVVQNLIGNYNLITLIREPVHRFLSFYHYAKNSPTAIEHEEVKDLSLSEAILDPTFVGYNRLCSYLGGDSVSNPYERACYNIENTFTFFGFQERYSEFFAIMQRRFGWTGVVIRQEEHISGVPQVSSLSKDMYEVLCEHNKLDIDLYGFAWEVYEKRRLGWLR